MGHKKRNSGNRNRAATPTDAASQARVPEGPEPTGLADPASNSDGLAEGAGTLSRDHNGVDADGVEPNENKLDAEVGGGAVQRSTVAAEMMSTTMAKTSNGVRNGVIVGGTRAGNATSEHVGEALEGNGVGAGANGDVSSVKADYEKALLAFRRGNHNKALRLMKESCARHDNSPLSLRLQGNICMKIAALIEDPSLKQRHMRTAIESAKKAVLLSPQSIEFAHYYAQLLYEASSDSKDYEEVVKECERALSIENPVDPAKDSLQDESQQKQGTPQARISQVQQELRTLVQKSNIASISSWVKNLGNGSGEEKFRIIPMRRVDDPMEVRMLQNKRPHEIKKNIKTPEERRKEIEVRVAAARLLQQRNETSIESSDQRSNQLATGNQRAERRKTPNSRKLSHAVSIEEKMEQVKPFWYSMENQKRQEMLEISVEDLKSHWMSSKDNTITELLSEALSFAHANKTWRFWLCRKCNDKFVDNEVFMQHVVREHVESLSHKFQAVLPQEIDSNWADQLMNGDCRPIDGPAAMKLLVRSLCGVKVKEHMAGQLHSVGGGSDCSGNVSDTGSSSQETCLENNVDCISKTSNPTEVEGEDDLKLRGASQSEQLNNVEFVREERHSNMDAEDHKGGINLQSLAELWPLVDDIEREKLLERIYSLFRALITHKCLAASHLSKVIQYAVDELQILIPEASMHYEIKQSPVYIRFLQAHQLRNVVKYLRDLAHSCGLERYSDKISTQNISEDCQEADVQERLILNDDFTSLVLDERLLTHISNGGNLEKSSSIVISQLTGFSIDEWQDKIPLVDLQLAWIFGSCSYELQPLGWMQLKEEKSRQGMEVLRTLDNEFKLLQNLCERKFENLSYEEALNAVENLCLEEHRKREETGKVASQSYDAILEKRKSELSEGQNDSLLSQYTIERDAIKNILQEAKGPPRFGYDLSELDVGEDDKWRKQESLPLSDSCIQVAIQRQKDHYSTEVSKLDAKIMRNVFGMQQLELKLGHLSSLDYRIVVLPLIKSFLKSRLEDAAEKDATEKSDAVREAFLAELARDAKRNDDKGLDQLKHPQEKSKDKKKNKDHRRTKDVKGTSNGGQQNILEENICECVTEDEQDKTGGQRWIREEESKRQEEDELKWQFELEAEERKLEETLELQRKIEEEAKQKHLAEISKKQTEEERRWCMLKDSNSSISSDPYLNIQETTNIVNECKDSYTYQQQLLVDANSVPPGKKIFSFGSYPGEASTFPEERDFWLDDCQNYSIHQEKHISAGKDKSYLGSFGQQNHQAVKVSDHVDKGSLMVDKSRLTTMQMDNKIAGEAVVPDNSLMNQERHRLQDSNSHSNFRSGGDKSLQVTEREKFSSSGQKSRGHRSRQKSNTQIPERGTYTYIPKASSKHENSQFAENGVIEMPDSLPHNPLPMPGSNRHGRTTVAAQTRTGLNQGVSEKSGVVSGENNSKTLRQLHAEEDDEERFQAELEQAVRQSLDAYNAKHSSLSLHEATKTEGGYPMTDGIIQTSSVLPLKVGTEVETFGKGLQNEVGEYNCFLNVIIQSLWHLRRFREEFLALSKSLHVHVGDPCVVCALHGIFVALSSVTTEANHETVAPTSLRIALSTLYPESNFFQQAQMNDASEVLGVIFDCMHRAFTSNGTTSDSESDGSTNIGLWDCQNQTCIAHRLFGLDISEQMNCKSCGLESRNLKYTSFFHNINASALRTMKIMYIESSLDELLKFVEMNHQLACDAETGGCGRLNYIHHLLGAAPRVFTTVLGWQNNCENIEDILATLDAITTEIDVGVIYRGLDEGYTHRLVSVVCYYGQHYHCFAYSFEHARWVMYDDRTVKVVGGWDEVIDTCRRGHLQPQVLFYEATDN
ncbi:uncharacterized protein LOC131066556 isoform X1 [Cryptomeria japonica]|uniref:uncharacterized protein LOC131066556 isoform X1 n=1 Tax=Cryptomeria japonica TaxID=3369 RepID=UPI0027DA8219|nr:uncharacterized protein LOC131066556 isoform X1 [Cryptomeria japonica]XP_057857331.2 uncharacterized protein LOC131066556 isoform X1 [Cryptomeria japonica]XP_057857332.2 uncharacterized protein LOC131066556 isoform X1 [Cryptomeria japonica]